MDAPDNDEKLRPRAPYANEPEHEGPIWTHPYLLYALLTLVLFVFLAGMAWLAVRNGWLPTR